jgi:hypothetical protein
VFVQILERFCFDQRKSDPETIALSSRGLNGALAESSDPVALTVALEPIALV